MCDDPIVIPSESFDFVSFEIMIGDIFVVPFFARCIFAPEYAISDVFLLG